MSPSCPWVTVVVKVQERKEQSDEGINSVSISDDCRASSVPPPRSRRRLHLDVCDLRAERACSSSVWGDGQGLAGATGRGNVPVSIRWRAVSRLVAAIVPEHGKRERLANCGSEDELGCSGRPGPTCCGVRPGTSVSHVDPRRTGLYGRQAVRPLAF